MRARGRAAALRSIWCGPVAQAALALLLIALGTVVGAALLSLLLGWPATPAAPAGA